MYRHSHLLKILFEQNKTSGISTLYLHKMIVAMSSENVMFLEWYDAA